jgi:predicted O-methyltransferase YrrM
MYNVDIDGWMSVSELIQIEEWASLVPLNGTIVEVGSYKGRSAYAWAGSCDPSVKVYCIDRFDGDFVNDFNENLKEFSNVVPIKGNVPYSMPEWEDKEIDVFFLDGLHSNPHDIDAINYFLPLIKKGGILCGHDYYPNNPEWAPDIIENIKHLEKKLNQTVTSWTAISSLWMFRI